MFLIFKFHHLYNRNQYLNVMILFKQALNIYSLKFGQYILIFSIKP